MLTALVILAIGAAGAGFVGVGGKPFHTFLSPVFEPTFVAAHAAAMHGHEAAAHGGFWAEHWLMVASGMLSIIGIIAAYVLYVKQRWLPSLVRASAPEAYDTLWNKYHVDELYDLGVVNPARTTGRVCVGLDDYFIDGLVWFVTAVPRGLALLLRGLQSGVMQGYALSMVAGIAIIMVWVFWR
jgi:NADH-quinone oxidoreductase subunit L